MFKKRIFLFLCILLAFGLIFFSLKEQESKLEIPKENITNALGYITSVYQKEGKIYLDFDEVKWLTDKEAIQASIEDGKVCFFEEEKTKLLEELETFDISNGYGKFGICAPNGYYISNKDVEKETYEISENAEFIVQSYGSGECFIQFNEVVDKEIFQSFWEKDPACVHLKDMPYRIEIQNNLVIKIKEQYIP